MSLKILQEPDDRMLPRVYRVSASGDLALHCKLHFIRAQSTEFGQLFLNILWREKPLLGYITSWVRTQNFFIVKKRGHVLLVRGETAPEDGRRDRLVFVDA